MKKILFITLLTIIGVVQLNAQVSITERQALIDLYNSTNGSNWSEDSNWNTSLAIPLSDVSTWHGIKVENIAGQDHVVSIKLDNNNLIGSIPSSFGNLSQLRTIVFSNNSLSGSANFSGIIQTGYNDSLLLHNNNFTGIILDSLTAISANGHFQIQNNPLLRCVTTYQLATFYNTNRNYIDIQTMFFSTCSPDSILSMSEIEGIEDLINNSSINFNLYKDIYANLNLSNKGFVYSQVGGVNRVTEVRFNGYGLSGTLPSSFGHFTECHYLDLSNNSLLAITDSVLDYTLKLKYVDISSNPNLGVLDTAWFDISTIEFFKFNNINCEEIQFGIGKLSNLKYINFASNDIELIPTSIENWTSLQTLIAAPNPINSIPTEIEYITLLEYLDLSSCLLTNLPNEIGDLTNLKTLLLDDNLLQILNPGIGNLTNLEELTVRENRLHFLPANFGNLPGLVIQVSVGDPKDQAPVVYSLEKIVIGEEAYKDFPKQYKPKETLTQAEFEAKLNLITGLKGN